MTNQLKISGHSDDIICVESIDHQPGNRMDEEFYPNHTGIGYLKFNNGTCIKAEYNDDGQWKISVVRLTEGDSVERHFEVQPGMDEAKFGYTDILVLNTYATDVILENKA